jgi:DNA-binding CsgD family transcriptional regulator
MSLPLTGTGPPGPLGPYPGSRGAAELPDGDGRAGGAPALTARDRELVHHLAKGRSTAQIAAAMSVSSNTTRTRIRRVRAKLAVDARGEVVPVARARGAI